MLNLIAPINNLGYGIAGWNILKALYAIDHSVTLYPISQPDNFDDVNIIAQTINNQINFDTNKPCIKLWHQHDLQLKVGSGTYFGFPIFELTNFNSHELVSMSHCDKIMVCSDWAKEIVTSGVKKFNDSDVYVIPLGVNSDIFIPCISENARPTTIFLNCGKWEIRKGHDILCQCFNDAFDPNDDVELWMLCDNPFIGTKNDEWKSMYKNSKLGEKIRIIPRQQSQKDVYNIMRLSDCGIFPSRAEGWNLELLEMMSCGKHVITTNYSAHTQFCNKDNSMLIEINNLETAFDGIFFDGKCGFWAELSDNQKEQTIEYMRLVHKKKQSKQLGINFNGIQTATNFSWHNSARKILDAIRF